MTRGTLLHYFDRICEGQRSNDRLRSFILDLAVRGRLTVQDVRDESASKLLDRINSLVSRSSRASKDDQALLGPDIEWPFQIPGNWCWSTLGRISSRIHYGYTASASQAIEDVRMLRITDIQNNSVDWNAVPGCEIEPSDVATYRLATGDILIARTGGTIGKTFLVSEMPVVAVFASYLIRVQPSGGMFDQYLKLFLESPVYWRQLKQGTRGAGQPNVNGQTLGRICVSIPPYDEQIRIVAKVNELTGLCQALATAQDRCRTKRESTALACLQSLEDAQSSDLSEIVSLYLKNLPSLTSTDRQIEFLKVAVFNYAVKGRFGSLVSAGVSARDLLAAIEVKKSDLVKHRKQRKGKPLPAVAKASEPFTIPNDWIWARVGMCAISTDYGTSVKSEEMEEGVPILAMGNIQGGNVVLNSRKRIPSTSEGLPSLYLEPGDLLYNRTNSAELVGKTGIYLGDRNSHAFASYLIRIRVPQDLIDPRWLNLAMNASYFRETQILPEIKQQCGQANVNGSKLRNMLVPIPPLDVQRRIVDAVESLLATCTALEDTLRIIKQAEERLMDSVLHSALAGINEPPNAVPANEVSLNKELHVA